MTLREGDAFIWIDTRPVRGAPDFHADYLVAAAYTVSDDEPLWYDVDYFEDVGGVRLVFSTRRVTR